MKNNTDQDTTKQSKDVTDLFRTIEEKSISFEEKRVKNLAKKYKMFYINLQKQALEPEALVLIPKEKAQAGQIICFHRAENTLRLGVTDPHNKLAQEIVEELQKQHQCLLYLISEASLEHSLSLYPLVVSPSEEEKKGKEEIIRVSEDLIKKAKEEIEGWPTLGDNIINKPVEEIVSLILARALKARASDIHLEPKADDVLFRLRIDGIMHDIISFSLKIYPRLLSRLKLLSGLKLNVTQTPQDGRFTIYYNHDEVDIRTSTIPTNYGESIDLRLLGLGEDYLLKIENLGIEEKESKIIKNNLSKPSGMILLTGSTGSGKTTTLYAFLNYKKDPEIKIMTLEDPIEYRLIDLIQIQINEREGLNFAQALRGVLRQDPDVIMIGEIRDPETAQITVRAATTGHLVFSTLHAGSTSEIITQLTNMGADPQNLSDVLNLLINQNLVRRLCLKCRKAYPAPREVVAKIKNVVQDKFPIPEKLTLYRAKGCLECENIGYQGRVGIFEIINISKNIRTMIANRATPEEIANQALKEGMVTLIQDGLRKVVAGKTTLEELQRVT